MSPTSWRWCGCRESFRASCPISPSDRGDRSRCAPQYVPFEVWFSGSRGRGTRGHPLGDTGVRADPRPTTRQGPGGAVDAGARPDPPTVRTVEDPTRGRPWHGTPRRPAPQSTPRLPQGLDCRVPHVSRAREPYSLRSRRPPPAVIRLWRRASGFMTRADVTRNQENKKSCHSGMLPCLRGGAVSRLVRRVRSALVIATRVVRGGITAST